MITDDWTDMIVIVCDAESGISVYKWWLSMSAHSVFTEDKIT